MEDSFNHTENESINPESSVLSQQPIEDNVISTSNHPVGIPLSSQGTERFSSTSRRGDTKLDSCAKIAIPRLQNRTLPQAIRRVPRACHSCRQRKTKCSGDTPACRQCLELRVTCEYPLRKTDKMKEQLGKTTEKSQEYEDMLKHTIKLVGVRAAEQIRNLLNKHNSGLEPPAGTEEQEDSLEIDGTSSPSSIGSLEAIDRVEEDFNRTDQGRSTGFMGKNSEITWMRQLQKEAKQRSHGLEGEIQSSSAQSPNEFKLPAFNYHLDDLGLDNADPGDPFEIPPRKQVDQLFEDYMQTVQPFFPIVNRPLFCTQCYNFLNNGALPSNKWLAIFNMVLAIAAKHTHLINSTYYGHDQDHALYLKRACTLSMNQKSLFDPPDLQQVQVEGLIAFYFLSAGHINRAWRFSALAIRSAIGLGVNMKIRSDSIPNIQKESRYRVWWSLYTIEHMLGIITGRTTCIRDGVCTTPLPVPFEEESLQEQAASELLNDAQLRDERINRAMPSWLVRQMPLNPRGGKEISYAYRHKDSSWIRSVPVNWGLYYLFYCDLAIIVQEIVNKVYSVDCVVIPWAHIENRIGELRARVDLWLSNLPPSLDFTSEMENDSAWIRGKLYLAFHFYSARITLGRPCLCRRDPRPINSEQKETFSHSIAVVTLQSASHMLELLPDRPDGALLFHISPWFCVTHYIMQAATVLLLELAFGCVHMPEQESSFLALAKKSIRWLHAMAKHSMASLRAWQLCDLAFRRLAMGMAYSTDDLPTCVDNMSADSPIIERSTETQRDAPFEGHPVEGMPLGSMHQTPHENQFSFYLDHGNFPPEEMNSWAVNTAEPDYPYDPISSGFIQSIFPEENDQENFDHL